MKKTIKILLNLLLDIVIITLILIAFKVIKIDFKINHKATQNTNQEIQNVNTEAQSKDTSPVEPIKETPEKLINKHIINIKLNPMRNFSGMSSEEILKLRTNAVKNSVLFSSMTDYKPNPNVFQIESGAQWISAYEISCHGVGEPTIGNGDSRESVGILNPELMFYPEILNLELSKRNRPCGKEDYLIPYKVTYDPEIKEITVYIDFHSLGSKIKPFSDIYLHNANPPDLGYKFAYAEKFNNIRFINNPNFSNTVVGLNGYYHKGFSCEHPDGCNNYSPYEPVYDFKITDLPATINIKLWKEQPPSEFQPADLNYKMIFE